MGGDSITELLQAHREGDDNASERLLSMAYSELRQMAHRQLQYRRPGQTLNTTGLVHEAYIKLFDKSESNFNDRVHFYALSAKAMRQILVDYARKVNAEKRGGKQQRTDLHPSMISTADNKVEILDMDDALKQLQELSPRMAQIVELRFFGGMSIEEIAAVLSLSSRTVDRDWLKAKSFLYLVLAEETN
jgi:RNA polymerase sigma factor (TIGR02999 family)